MTVKVENDRKLPKEWQKIQNGSITKILSFKEMCRQNGAASDCLRKDLKRSFGGKASNLGFLNHPTVLGEKWGKENGFDYPLTSDGFGIPISYYFDLVNHNPVLKTAIEHLIEWERSGELTPEQLVEQIKLFKKCFMWQVFQKNSTIALSKQERISSTN